jgi:hypothetical protein
MPESGNADPLAATCTTYPAETPVSGWNVKNLEPTKQNDTGKRINFTAAAPVNSTEWKAVKSNPER